MSQGDPTDNALAAIASILDQPSQRSEARREPPELPVTEPVSVVPPPLPPEELEQAQDGPVQEEAHAPVQEPVHEPVHEPEPEQEPEPIPVQAQPVEANGYFKVGPGPMAAIRFQWTVREDSGNFYVDETFGENSTPIVNGPMGREAAIQFVDDRESAARLRFEQLKSEMAGRAAAANLVRRDSGES